MSSNKQNRQRISPVRSPIWSIRTLFLLIMAGGSILLFSLLLWAGVQIMNSTIHQFGTEILTEKLYSVINPIDLRYETLKRIGLEDSQTHRNEIKEDALKQFAQYRYKETGTLFVIHHNRSIILSHDFKTIKDTGFDHFFINLVETKTGDLEYLADNIKKFAIIRYYEPWESYIGLSINQQELYALKDLFIKVSIILFSIVLLGTIILITVLQRLIITPLLRLTYFATQVGRGRYDEALPGRFILELGMLKTDMLQMVSTLRLKMNQAAAQIEVIKEREASLDEALAALKLSEKKYKTIYNAPSDAILIIDPKDGQILDTNKATLLMYGFTQDELPSLSIADLSSHSYPYTEKEAMRRIRKASKKGSQLFEWMCRKNNGELFWAEISLQSIEIGGKLRVVAVIRNVHARKMAQQELASEKERLTVTLRSIGDGVITTDILGRVVLMNRVAEGLTGWRHVEAVGRRFSEVFRIIHQNTETDCENPVDKILASGSVVELDENTILISKDGTRRNIADSGAPINNPDNEIIGAVLVFRDITDEKRMEEELLKIRKLESVGILAGGIAHDFNNILVAILGNVSLARQRLNSKEDADALLKNTEKAALRAKDLTSQLLTFSRGGEPVLETTSLESMIRESAEFVLRGSNIQMSMDIPVDLWLVNIDPGQIGQVVQNIVLNARQEMQDGGEIQIRCRNCENCESSKEKIKERCVQVIISDTGDGIPEELLPKIFDPYFTTKENGSGLGLAICHSIINKHGGNIQVDSLPGAGTTFTLQLPVSQEQKIDTMQAVSSPPSKKGKARILIMDDDPMIRELSQQMLDFLGHDVATSIDGQEALNMYTEAMHSNEPFDIIIMDLTIPGGMGGKKAIKELLTIDPNACAIVSSGYSHDPVMADYTKYGFKAVVVKPYQIDDLERAIQETLLTKQA